MSRVQEIKAAIEQLTPEERCELAALLNPIEDDDWDRKMKKDAQPGGRLDRLRRYAERMRPTEHDPRIVDPLDWLLADERASLVRQAIGRLPRREVEILLLKYSESWSYEQLAQHLGITESAVESRLHRARRRLRQELAVLEPTATSKSTATSKPKKVEP